MLTQREKHDKIYDQLVYELFCEKPREKKPVKSSGGVCKRAKFLQRNKEEKIKDPIVETVRRKRK